MQAQTVQDFELLIIGDGVQDDTRAIAAGLVSNDPRIRFLDFPKGPRKGEAHRHTALSGACGDVVAYLGDDDIWLPEHLETLVTLLENADFGHTLHIGINRAGERFALVGNLAIPAIRTRMCNELFNRFDLTFGGHTLAAYRRLPQGWHTTPDDFPWTDLYFWRQFLTQPWCRAATAMTPTAICTQTHLRPHVSDAVRATELRELLAEAATPGFREALWRLVLGNL